MKPTQNILSLICLGTMFMTYVSHLYGVASGTT